jgi:hypothetical protein
MSAVPTFEEELDVKVLNTVESLYKRWERGEIDGPMYKTAIESVFNSVSGMVSNDMFNILSEAKVPDTQYVHVDRQILTLGNRVLMIGQLIGSEKLLITTGIGSKEVKREIKTFETPKKARDMLKAMVARLETKGYLAL